MDKELLRTLSNLLDEKLNPIKEDITNMNTDITDIKTDITNMKTDIKNIQTQQEESISILKSLEHTSEVNKSEHDKLFNELAKLSGTVENMRKDLSAVEVVTARNMENIAQLKLVK